MIIILIGNWMISITREQSWSYMILVEKTVYTSADVSMLCYGCGVSQYPQFYHQDLDKYQVLPHPDDLEMFEGDNKENFIKEKWQLDLAGQAETFVWECIGKSKTKKYYNS